MMKRLMFVAGVAVGYVLGTRDGRGRYEQIKSQADSLWHDPRLHEKVSTTTATVKDTVKEKAPEVQAKLADAASHAADAAKTKLHKSEHPDDTPHDTPGAAPTSP